MTESHDNTTCRRATTTDPVQVVAEALVAHTRLSGDGRCSCGHTVPLGHSFPEHQAEDAVAAARPIIEREAKAEAWDEGANTAWERSTPEVNGQRYWWRTHGEPTNPYRIEREGQA